MQSKQNKKDKKDTLTRLWFFVVLYLELVTTKTKSPKATENPLKKGQNLIFVFIFASLFEIVD